MRSALYRITPLVIIAIVFYFGLGVITHLIFFSAFLGEPSMGSVSTWAVIVAWPAVYFLFAAAVMMTIFVVTFVLGALQRLLMILRS